MNKKTRQKSDSWRYRTFGTNMPINFLEKAAYKSLYIVTRLPAFVSVVGGLVSVEKTTRCLCFRGNMVGTWILGQCFRRVSAGNAGPWIPFFLRFRAFSMENAGVGVLFQRSRVFL